MACMTLIMACIWHGLFLLLRVVEIKIFTTKSQDNKITLNNIILHGPHYFSHLMNSLLHLMELNFST